MRLSVKAFKFLYGRRQEKQITSATLATVETGRAIQEGWRVVKSSFFWASVVITAVHNEKKVK